MIRERVSRDLLWRGALAGALAGVVLTFMLAILRLAAGVPLVGELLADRLLPLLPVDTFLKVIGIFGGTMLSKEVAFFGAFVGQVAIGAVAGVLFAVLTRQPGRSGSSWRRPLVLLAGGVGLIWIGLLLGLWPVLGANASGLTPSTATPVTAACLLGALVLFALTLRFAFDTLATRPATVTGGWSRRHFLVGAGSLAALLASGGLVGTLFRRGTFVYDGLQTRPPLAPVTPVSQFYVVTKNLVDPYVDPAVWRLEVSGMVDEPRTYDLQTLKGLPSVTQATTMECISNGVGYGLISNAIWTGVPMRNLLNASRPRVGVVRVVMEGADGFIHTISYEKSQNPTTMIATRMNESPLSQRHGAPARMIVPGTYGEVHVKWLTRIQLVGHELKGYYESQGWQPYYVHTMAKISEPHGKHPISLAGQPVIPVRGVAFAGERGISSVEVSTDAGQSWSQATIEYAASALTWAIWSYAWRPGATGERTLVVRATDGQGTPQEAQVHGTAPAGATGYHHVKVVLAA